MKLAGVVEMKFTDAFDIKETDAVFLFLTVFFSYLAFLHSKHHRKKLMILA